MARRVDPSRSMKSRGAMEMYDFCARATSENDAALSGAKDWWSARVVPLSTTRCDAKVHPRGPIFCTNSPTEPSCLVSEAMSWRNRFTNFRPPAPTSLCVANVEFCGDSTRFSLITHRIHPNGWARRARRLRALHWPKPMD